MMVDNSIVVLESCFRSTKGKRHCGIPEAALEGSGIVLQSIIGSTVTTCVVFLPLALLQGLTGQMFKPLGFTIIFCMVASPHQCNDHRSALLLLLPPAGEGGISGRCFDPCHAEWLSQHHEGAAEEKTENLFTSVALLVAAFWMASQLRMELMVSDDTGEISVSIETRPGLTLEEKTGFTSR